MQNNLVANAIRLVLAGGAVSFSCASAHAQTPLETDASQARNVVTGSRIERPQGDHASPLLTIDREEILRSGHTSIGDLMQDLPISGAALNTQFNGGGNGSTYVDLRNLGSNRTLVLLNGRRLINSLAGRADLNNIPIAVVERIEVLKGGASSIYGSDAIAGVINIITRREFEGVEANAYIGQYDENDGETQHYDFSVGATSKRGAVFFNVSYVQVEPIVAGDRTISSEPQFGTGNAFGSSGTPQGRFGSGALGSFRLTTDPGTNVTGPGGLGAAAFRPGDFSFGAPGDGSDRYNMATNDYILTPQERTSVFLQGHYDLSQGVRVEAEASYNQRLSSQQLGPTPLFLGMFGSGFASSIGVAVDNRYNPFGIELLPSTWLLGRRLVEAGNRQFNQDVDSYRFDIALTGDVKLAGRPLNWEANYLYADLSRNDIAEGRPNVQRVAQALSGQPCRDDAFGDGCVELNVFGGQGVNGEGTITRPMLDYILFTEQATRGNTLRSYNANLTGELFDMPAGPLGFAVGYEYRQEEGFDQPDALIASGITSGNARQPTDGSFSLDEFYAELAVPLLADVSGAERLDLSLAMRYSDYDTFGDTTNFKVGLVWQPFADLLLRGTWAEGFRAPNIAELFSGQGDSFPTITDPCSDFNGVSDGSQASAEQIQNCISQGVPADGSYIQPGHSIRTTVGSNPNLQPETSESYTLGLVYNPSWLDGLDISIDYYDIDLDDSITSIGAQAILNACASSLSFCDLIARNSSGEITNLLAAGVNLGGNEVKGADLLVTYSLPETNIGFFQAAWDIAYQSDNIRITLDRSGDSMNERDRIGFDTGSSAYARWKSKLDMNWHYGDWSATYGLHDIHGTRESCSVPPDFGFCNLNDANGNPTQRKIGALTYHDVQATYHLSQYDTRFTLGVDNLFDKGPPLSTSSFGPSYNQADYRLPGRFPYIRVSVDF